MRRRDYRPDPFCLAALALPALGACDRSAGAHARPGEPTSAPAPIVATKQALRDNEPAIQSIVAARCERGARCANVGAGEKWASAEACRGELLAKNRDELRASECPGGVVQKELDERSAEIRSEDCDNPLDTLGRLAACRSSDLCNAIPRGRGSSSPPPRGRRA
jgi:hypothetical protein